MKQAGTEPQPPTPAAVDLEEARKLAERLVARQTQGNQYGQESTFGPDASGIVARALLEVLRQLEQAKEADTFWDWDNSENPIDEIDEFMEEVGPGVAIRLQRAKSLPDKWAIWNAEKKEAEMFDSKQAAEESIP